MTLICNICNDLPDLKFVYIWLTVHFVLVYHAFSDVCCLFVTSYFQVLNGEHYRQNLTSSVAEEQYIDNIVMEHADGNVEELAHSQMVDGLIYEEGIQSNRVQHGEAEYESLMEEEMAEEGQVAAEEIVTDGELSGKCSQS